MLKPRRGNKADKHAIVHYFEELGFTIRVFEEMEMYQIEAILKMYAKDQSSSYDLLLCFFLTHGFSDLLCAKDQAYRLKMIFEPFLPQNCEKFVGVPKLFIINACRGRDYDKGNDVQFDAPGVPIDIPEDDDFLVAMSSTPGFKTLRHSIFGSFYIKYLIKTLRKSRAENVNEDIHSILTTVQRKIAFKIHFTNKQVAMSDEERKKYNRLKQMPIFFSTLRDKLSINRNYKH
ncbi:caspase-6-like isoform X2 [Leptotrombidium deliense]|uniref:Caspase-6-like isoform X2 n=1 Tax=Leptotrombidium deliense TaxID=299467 RepID=A0A443SCC9_9ACAR|nr:caspase-6-like isoform X2 [Leptotrombidium deliense]